MSNEKKYVIDENTHNIFLEFFGFDLEKAKFVNKK